MRALIVATGDEVDRPLPQTYDTEAEAQIAIIALEAEDQGC